MRDRRIVPYNLRLKATARTLRRDSAPAERKLWYEFLRELPEKFTRQKPLGGYVVDFYCSRLRLVSLNLEVVRFTNAEVMDDFEGVCLRIRQTIAKKTYPPARLRLAAPLDRGAAERSPSGHSAEGSPPSARTRRSSAPRR